MIEADVTVVDYGMGNIGSIVNMFTKIGARPIVARTPDEIESSTRLVLPGVGSFDSGMRQLEEKGMLEPLNRKAIGEGVPSLGICLGMQLLTERSEEGQLSGLGWIQGEARRLPVEGSGRPLRLPHMGWNTVDVVRQDGLYGGMSGEIRFYFVHSYGVTCRSDDDVLSVTTYGEAFVSALQKENIYGTQFHPEKSHKFGMKLLSNFMRA